MDISVIILSRQGKIPDRLKKSLKFADEVLVLTTPNITDFAEERNKALKKAEGNWVLFVDDDEVVSTALAKEIAKAITNPTVKGYEIPRDNYFLGRLQGKDYVLRLAKRNSGIWKRKVHEIWDVRGKIGRLKNHVSHINKNSLHEEIIKINFYSNLHAEANRELGLRSGIINIVLFPPAKFMQVIFDGRGFVIAFLHSFHSFLAWSKLYIWQKKST